MKIAASHTEKNLYATINQVANGKLYEQLQAIVAEPLPEHYDMFKAPQRQRIGASRVAEQFQWAFAKDGRSQKPGSELGANILKYLEMVELDHSTAQSVNLANAIPQKLGEVVTRIMVANEQKPRAPDITF